MTYVFANWKMYLDLGESVALAKQYAGFDLNTEDVQVSVFPSALAYSMVAQELDGSPLALGAQDIAAVQKGAYTGAISAELYKAAGATYALVGHSERRHLFGESNDDVKKKFAACLDAGLIPILCIGETKEDTEAGKREYRLKKQLYSALDGLDVQPGQFFVAYEPVWAIGTGDACDHLEAAAVHDMIKAELTAYTQEEIPVLYGGSLDEKNVVSYLPHSSIDGYLIGSASTRFDRMDGILNAVLTA